MPTETNLSYKERKLVEEITKEPATVIFEVIRREGEHEISRPLSALWWSGVAAGLAISTSVLCKGALVAALPDAEWSPIISNFGYTVGFLIVILARMQLFTENTITPILPLFYEPTIANFARTGRLWLIVFVANLFGCFLSAAVVVYGGILPANQFEGIMEVSRHYAASSAFQHFAWGIPAGFIIAALVWILPRMESAGEILIIIILTYTIGIGGMSHVVAGSTELFNLVLNGELGLSTAVFSGILPALAGNVLGGTFIFTAMTYAQIREEV